MSARVSKKSTGAGTNVLTVYNGNAIPSWRKYGRGTATLELTGHPAAKWVSVVTTEAPDKGPSRETYFTLGNRAEVEAVRDFLNEILNAEGG